MARIGRGDGGTLAPVSLGEGPALVDHAVLD
jgi:hypothetical protein